MTDNTEISSQSLDSNTAEVVVQATREIEKLRLHIDEIDDEIVRLLAQRFTTTEKVGRLKAAAGFAPLDAAREERQLARMSALAVECGLDPSIAHAYRDFVVTASKKRHAAIAADNL
ncbi:chorismate mutase [Alloscardovia omnicolens]|uniref:chorismate mutase n=1 Tax=Alloscardovia omnicolens TaxID=419015 RepID=UPI003A6D7C02